MDPRRKMAKDLSKAVADWRKAASASPVFSCKAGREAIEEAEVTEHMVSLFGHRGMNLKEARRQLADVRFKTKALKRLR